MAIDLIERLYSHLDWADQSLLALISSYPPAQIQPAVRLFSHVLASERVWLLRLRQEDSSTQPIWPDLTLEALESLATANHTEYTHYLAGTDEQRLESEITYRNQSGREFRNRVDDVLLHVAMHGSYHRGQIAAAIRAAGGEPVNTDYITYVRETSAETR